MDASKGLRRALRLSNADQEMLRDDRNNRRVSKIRAFIKVPQLGAQNLEQIGFGVPFHMTNKRLTSSEPRGSDMGHSIDAPIPVFARCNVLPPDVVLDANSSSTLVCTHLRPSTSN